MAVVVPDPDFLCGWAKRTLGLQGSYEELCSKAVIPTDVLLLLANNYLIAGCCFTIRILLY